MAQMSMTLEKSIKADVTVSHDRVKRAYVTFLAGNKDYWMGVVGLAKGLRKVKSAYPLVVAILPDVPEEHRQILLAQGCIIREIEPVYPPENKTGYSMAYYVINYSKLRIWEVKNFLTICLYLCLFIIRSHRLFFVNVIINYFDCYISLKA